MGFGSIAEQFERQNHRKIRQLAIAAQAFQYATTQPSKIPERAMVPDGVHPFAHRARNQYAD